MSFVNDISIGEKVIVSNSTETGEVISGTADGKFNNPQPTVEVESETFHVKMSFKSGVQLT